MSVGLNPSKSEIDTMAGVVARDLHAALNRVSSFAYYLDGKTDTQLLDLGYTSGEVAVLRSAYADLLQLVQVYQGGQTVANAKDFRAFARRVFGMGDV